MHFIILDRADTRCWYFLCKINTIFSNTSIKLWVSEMSMNLEIEALYKVEIRNNI